MLICNCANVALKIFPNVLHIFHYYGEVCKLGRHLHPNLTEKRKAIFGVWGCGSMYCCMLRMLEALGLIPSTKITIIKNNNYGTNRGTPHSRKRKKSFLFRFQFLKILVCQNVTVIST